MYRKERYTKESEILIKPELNGLRVLFFINMFLIITDFIMPQYFGLHIGWDITCTRLANIVLILYGLFNAKVFSLFVSTAMKCSLIVPLLAYLFVALYTMIFRVDVNAFMLVFLEMLTLLMLIFAIRYVIGCRRAIYVTIYCAYFLGIYGMVEYVAGYSLFLRFLRTVPTAVKNCYRSGHYRIMGPCGHPLGYGLLLLLFIPLACYDCEKDEVFLLKRPVLLGILMLNVFLTGSRSTLGIALVEMFAILLVSKRNEMKKSVMGLLGALIVLAIFLLLTFKTSIGRYLLMQITSVLDQVFGTEMAAYFGADVNTLKNSEAYREFLPRIFTLDWLNPILGRGVKRSFGADIVTPDGGVVYISSVDNYYICQFIKYAYPGLICYCLFLLVIVITMIRTIIKLKRGIFKVLFIAVLCYFVNLWWLDALQTLKFVYVIIAIFYACKLALESDEAQVKSG